MVYFRYQLLWIEKVKSYIRNQSEHHRQKIVADELGDFLSVQGVEKCTAVMVCYSNLWSTVNRIQKSYGDRRDQYSGCNIAKAGSV